MLARQQGVLRDREMQSVGRADVNGIDGRVFQEAMIVRFRALDAELVGELLGFLDLWFADCIELDVSEAANPSR